MGKKLHLFLSLILLYVPVSIWAQCPTSVSISADIGTTVCSDSSNPATVTFTASPTGGTSLHYQWQVNNIDQGSDQSTFSLSDPKNNDKIKVIVTSDDDGTCIKTSNVLTMTVNVYKTPTVSITSAPAIKCVGQNVTFTASNTNGGNNPSYSWYVNSASTPSQSSSSNTFMTASLPTGANSVRVVLTSNINCASPTTAEATANITINPAATISTPGNINSSVCINSSLIPIVFSIGGSGSGATVTGLPSGLTGNYSSGNFTISGTPTVAGTFNYTVNTTGSCTAATNSGTITVNKNATISLTSANNQQTLCQNQSISNITYAIGETGNSATVTGLPAGINGNFSGGVYTLSGSSSVIGTHNYSIKATGSCDESTALTGKITITQNLTPSVSIISSDADNIICAGTAVTFTATPTNGGNSPSYQWKVNGGNAGTNSPTFTTSSLTNGQSVSVVLTSNETCVTQANATSNVIATTVNPNLTPSVSIAVSDSDICAGESVTFTATPVNGGTSPSYQWKLNGSNVGTNSPTYTTSALTNAQNVSVVLTSNETCLFTATATSNNIAVQVNPNLTPSVSIVSNDSNNIICAGTSIKFTATPVNGGLSPSYQWQVNGSNVGTNSPTYTTTSLTNGQTVKVIMTSNEECLATPSATSNQISIQVDNSISGVTPTFNNTNPAHNSTAICPVASGLIYKINPIPGATSYVWTFPTGWTITAGANTNEVTATAGQNVAINSSNNITVRGVNECGQSQPASITITTGVLAYVNAGPDQTVCAGTTTIQLAAEIGGVISKANDFSWSANVAGGSFPSGNVNNQLTGNYTIPTSIINGGTVTLTITSVKPSGTCPDPKIDSMVLTVLPATTISNPTNKTQTVCLNTAINPISFNINSGATGATVTGLPAGVTGVYNSGVFTISGTPTAAGTFAYTVNTTGNCTKPSQTGTITVTPTQTLTDPANKNQTLCINSPIASIAFTGNSTVTGITATGLPAGINGIYSGGTFTLSGTPSVAGTFNYTINSTGSCTPAASRTGTLTIKPNPTISNPANKAQTVCINTAIQPIAFTITSPGTGATVTGLPAGITGNFSGGTYTLSGNPSIAGVFDYTVTSTGECIQQSQTGRITVTPNPTATISYTGVFCNSQSNTIAANLSGTGNYTGGTYSSSPSGLSINSSTGAITPASSNAGTYTVTYESPQNCEKAIATTSVTINQTPSVNINYTGPICNSDNSPKAVTFTNGVGAYQNGSFSSSAGLTINASTGAINASTSNPGTYTVSYKIPSNLGCSEVTVTTSVTIVQAPQVMISYPTPLCNSEDTNIPVSFNSTAGAYQGGTFSATAGLSIDSNGNINPKNSTTGVHTVTYTVPAASGCNDVIANTNVTIYKKVEITTQPSNVGICSTQPAEFEVIATGDNLQYQWYKKINGTFTKINGEIATKLHFNNATATNAGEYQVVVSGTSPCSSITSETVTLNVDENIVIVKPTEDITICDKDLSEISFEFIAHANGAPLNFTWVKDGTEVSPVTGKFEMNVSAPSGALGEYTGTLKILDINVNDSGVYAVKIKGPDYFTCSEAISKNFTFRVNPLPPQPGTLDLTYCLNDIAPALSASIETGNTLKWYRYDAPTDNFIYLGPSYTPPTNTPGTTSYWVTQTRNNGCESPMAELKVTVLNKPNPIATAPITFNFCYNDVVSGPISLAPTESGASVNWYSSATGGTPLGNAPTPVTSTVKITSYWVSQTLNNGCESDRVQVDIKVNPLPQPTITVASGMASQICLGSSTKFIASVATSYVWTLAGTQVGTGNELTVTPTAAGTYIYKVIGSDANSCSASAEITIKVDDPTVAGTLTGPSNVCITNASGQLTLTGYTGSITKWEFKPASSSTWTTFTDGNLTALRAFNNLTESTSFRVSLKNGVCNEAQVETLVTVDPKPIAGKLDFGTFGRIFLICQGASSGYSPLTLSGQTGQIVTWQYRKSSATMWTTIIESGGGNFVGTTLSASQIQNLNINETTVFRVEIKSGACTPNVFSTTAILSIIPLDIEPSPVTVNPKTLCFGSQVTLTAENGYTNRPSFLNEGAFDNASITSHGWRVRRDGSTADAGFSTDANNIRPNKWLRATPHDFITANLTSPYATSLKPWATTTATGGNKGFAIVSGNNPSTMETPVFGIDGLDQGILTFDQAYNLTTGAKITVEISTDGGNSYNTTLFSRTGPATSGNYASFGEGDPSTRPENKIVVDLGNYMGQNNLRIRFHFIGVRDGDVWALDNIDVPDGPKGVTMEWKDYTDPENPIFIGSSSTEQWTPKEIGWNTFEVRTKLIFNSSGDACATAINSETVEAYVFDNYTSTAAASLGSCGSFSVNLSGTITSANQVGNIISFPEGDGSTVKWEVIQAPTGYTYSASHFTPSINDPNAVFTSPVSGNFKLRWTITPAGVAATSDHEAVPANSCPITHLDAEFNILDCTTLDFDGIDDYVDLGTNYTGNYSIEAWIRPKATTGTIISGAGFEIKMQDLPSTITPNSRWYHIAVSQGKLYVDGIQVGNAGTGVGGNKTLIGAKWNSSTKKPENYFSGWIEEVRIWKTGLNLTQDQIRFMMNQHLQNAANMGMEIPMPVPGGLTYNDLAGYYRLISAQPDPLLPGGPISYPSILLPQNGYTPDLALTAVPGRLYNMTTNQQNTAPLPYYSGADGKWTSVNTWLRPTLWDIPNGNGINGNPIEWNIVRTFNNITSDAKDITVLGLKSETPDKKIIISNPSEPENENNSGQFIRITHYLLLDGNMDLVGESQLLQDEGSLLAETSKGWLERDQQGKKSSFNYNYWSSPVSLQGQPNNSGYMLQSVLLDGTDSSTPLTINFSLNPYAADGAASVPKITISSYWIWNFIGGVADSYGDWTHLGEDGLAASGTGYSMKGSDGLVNLSATQNYVFRGKPHNGNITLSINQEQNYLIGNPYPSALDGWEFIKDNLSPAAGGQNPNNQNVFNGSLYFWDHFSGKTHILEEYIGGYAVLNLSSAQGIPAISNDWRIDYNSGASGTKRPQRYIPIAQGFFVTSATEGSAKFSGNILFKNSQRIYKRENNGDGSIFLQQENLFKGDKTNNRAQEDDRPKIRLKYKSPAGYHRQILVTQDDKASADFDLGYDAPLIENNLEDMYWLIKDQPYVIQAVPDFEKERVLPLAIKVHEEGDFTIQIDSTENWPNAKMIYLKDKVLDTIHNIRKEGYVGHAVAGEINDRFELVFYKEEAQTTPPPVVDTPPDEEVPIDELPVIDGLVGISYSYFTKQVKIDNPELYNVSKVMIFDMGGKLIQEYHGLPSEREIILGMRPVRSGIYIVKVFSEKGISNKKIVIK